MSTFSNNFDWQKKYYSQVFGILKRNALHIVKVEVSNEEQDTKQATDFVVSVKGGRVAVRIRRDVAKQYRDFTIRAKMRSGYETELQKLKKGFADFYLYIWTENESIVDWILVDLKTMRESGLLDGERNLKWNRDGGSAFIAIAISELQRVGALLAKMIYPPTQRQP